MFNYTINEINTLAKHYNYNRDTFEKILRLLTVLTAIQNEPSLKEKYILKGGTAINLCLFDFPRLSVDLDFDFHYNCSKEDMEKMRNEHRKVIQALVRLEGYSISPKSRYSYATDGYILEYKNAMLNPDNIKLDINYINRVHLLPPQSVFVNPTFVQSIKIITFHTIELYASKIAALIGRSTARDVFDIYQMILQKKIHQEDMDMLRKCAIFYLLNSNELSISTLLNNFDNNLMNMSYHTIQRNLIPMLNVGTTIDLELMKNEVKNFIHELIKLTDKENKYVEAFISNQYRPEWLFDNPDICERIKEHPVVLWKMTNLKI